MGSVGDLTSDGVVRDLVGFLRLAGCESVDEVSTLVGGTIELDGWVVPYSDPENGVDGIEVVVLCRGTVRQFPFTIQELWECASELDDEECERLANDDEP